LGTIQPTVFLAETERARRRHPANLDAYEMCMKGWAHEVRMDRHSLVEARSCFQTAIDLDAGLAQAYSGLAGAHIWEWALRWSDDPGQSMAEAVRAAQRAVAIDEADEAAHVYVGMVSIFSGQLDAALKQLDRAIELNPNSAIARCVRSWAYSFDGRPDEGVKEAELALRSSPRDWFRFGFLHGLTLSQYMMRDYAAASETAMKLVALKPDYLYGHAILAMSCAQLGQSERAHAAMRDTLRLQPTFDAAFQESIAPCRDRADLEHLKEGLRKAGWEG
jgi:tetratricopeptide (TPR) repeat protein